MVVVVRQERKSRLSAMIDKPGGFSVGVALAQAQANLQMLQEKSLAIVHARIAELAALKPPAADADPDHALSQAYALSGAVIDAAGPFELFDLCTIASALCDLIDAAPSTSAFDWRIVTVHAQSMQLILTLPPEAAATRVQVLDSLKQVMARKLPAAAKAD